MFKKILVANRGEIASRIIRACKELNIRTVAIFSEQDATSLFVKKADESYMVGPGPLEGYLNPYRIVDLAKKIGVDAIHPGYGFLSENSKFARLCERRGITFIGPSSKAISDMGNKITARATMIAAGIPVLPGSDGPVGNIKEARVCAKEIGYPVMVKAAGGGGGRGLRVALDESELENAYESARTETKAAFGESEVFLEKYIEKPRHIEFQILADKSGKTIHLGERDCSIQRRHQKLIEISPSLFLDDKLRAEMGAVAVAAAKAVDYTNAGTVEFLMDKDKNYYFLEMNTRIQVEHPVTEEVTGIDLVRKQIEIAYGLPLGIDQEDVRIFGFAMQCRINAEDPKHNFAPCSGRVTSYYSPGGIGVRIDGTIYRDFTISPYYDSLIVKLIVTGSTWNETVSRMRRSLDEFVIRGVKTTIPYLRNIMNDTDFKDGNFDTSYIDRKPELLKYYEFGEQADIIAAISAAIAADYGF
ncbi:Biotin carboxylase of acetyl-CoA carboxylase [hydrothermal vent metagenome]|uniref:Biotin carboxylase of acetyl-CoA carboxylase n=1 Tax=hydrothermal vent metagenome TaxID=652676 RepID=A0A3B0V3Z2_9ZZZZ